MRILGRVFLAILFVAVIIVPLVSADEVNSSLVTAPFITIDPIGNHTIGDVFFINGTTNLPASGNLTMEITDAFINSPPQSKNAVLVFPLGKDVSIPYVSIIPDASGTNKWSVNVTDATKKLDASIYFVVIWSEINANCDRMDCVRSTPSGSPFTSMSAVFTLYPATTANATPFITIDPIGNHTIGDMFFINGTTNLPITENLTINIAYYKWVIQSKMKTSPNSPPPGESIILYTLPESSDTLGMNQWSAKIPDAINVSGEYLVFVLSHVNYGCKTNGCSVPKVITEGNFTLLPQNNDKLSSNVQTSVLQTTFQTPSSIQPTTSQTIVPITTQSSPLPVALPIVVLVIMVVLRSVLKER
jgi:hypothetical protein